MFIVHRANVAIGLSTLLAVSTSWITADLPVEREQQMRLCWLWLVCLVFLVNAFIGCIWLRWPIDVWIYDGSLWLAAKAKDIYRQYYPANISASGVCCPSSAHANLAPRGQCNPQGP